MALPLALAKLETAVREACSREEEWPAQIAAGIYAGVDYAIAHPELVGILDLELPGGADAICDDQLVARLAGLLKVGAPAARRLPEIAEEALVGGVVGLVADHLRIGRYDRLRELRPELVLITLLPYLGFAEAQRRANEAPARDST